MRSAYYGVATALETPRDIHWSTQARCAQPDVYPDWWHAENTPIRAITLHICHSHCPVLAQCRRAAHNRPPRPGVMLGGLLWAAGQPSPWQPAAADLCLLCGAPPPGCGTAYGATRHRQRHEKICPWCAEFESRRRRQRRDRAKRKGGRAVADG